MKRLKKTVQSKNTTRKKNNGGMTYVELLVALSLLVLIVTMFSPMLLSSYDRIYRAGEITSDAFDSRQDLEKGLSSREDHEILGVEAKFASNTGILANKIYIMAKRVVSSFDGLETLYVGGKGKIEIVNNEDGLVKDNQSSHIIRLKLTNLAYKDYDVIKDSAVIEQLNKGNVTSLRGKVRFYVCSIFDTATALEGEVVRKPNFKQGDSYAPYCDLRIDNVDITKSPLKIVAYYLNEYGSVKEATTYLTIEKSDVIFVGETSSEAQYFTLSDAGSFDAAVPVIAGRKMETAPIPAGKTLTDVAFIEASGAGGESYFSMCGQDGIARRLWHLTDANASTVSALDGTAINNDDPSRITFKSQALNGNQVYFQYDWAGDMNDLTAYTSKTGVSATMDYGSNSNSDANLGGENYLWKNEYNLDNNYFAYNFDGFNSNHGKFRDNHRRISYALECSQAEWEAATGQKMRDGIILRKGRLTKKDKEEVNVGNDDYENGENKSYLYCPECKTWWNVWYDFWGSWKINKASMTGLSLATGWGKNQNAQFSDATFSIRHCTAEDNQWGSNEWAGIDEGDNWQQSLQKESQLSSIIIKSYNTITPQTIATPNQDAKSNTAQAKVDFTSCNVIPGSGVETLYLGTVDSSTLINQSEGYIGANCNYSIDYGHCGTYVYITENGKTYKKYYRQMTSEGMSASLGLGGKVAVAPDSSFGYNSFKNEQGYNKYTSWEQDDVQFTLGYSSDLYKMYNGLSARDIKPLEGIYSSTMGVSDVANDHDSEFRKNLWFPREFLNMTQSDTYKNSLVVVGYDVGGYSKMLAELAPEWTTSTNTKYLSGIGDLDANNDGVVDCIADGTLDKSTSVTLSHGTYKLLVDVGTAGCRTSGCSGRLHFVDPCPNESASQSHSQTYISLPQHGVVSTVVDKVLNNGVISIYNANDSTFTPIGYYKDPAKVNVRFTAVSVDALQKTDENNGVLGAAIGSNSGRLFFATIGYVNGVIPTTTRLSWGSTLVEIAPQDKFGNYYKSIDTVKAFNLNGTFYILVGGKSANNKAYISLVTVNAGNPASSTVKHVKLAEVPYDVTDIILADKYVCFTSHQSDGSGSEGCVVIGELFANGAMKNIDTVGWKFITRYHTEFESDAETGAIKAKGDGTPLPRLKALASSVPVNYS